MREDYVDTQLSPDYKPEWSDLSFAGSSTTQPGMNFDRHYHDGAEYWFICGGRALVKVGDDQFIVGSGEIVATPPGVEHDILAVDPNAHLEMFFVATAVEPGGQTGHLHRGDDFEHTVGELNAEPQFSQDADWSYRPA
jgi:mannose-6-phosphate isomerase-like protein (cupin superfamily)